MDIFKINLVLYIKLNLLQKSLVKIIKLFYNIIYSKKNLLNGPKCFFGSRALNFLK